jgi:hypothetical protein
MLFHGRQNKAAKGTTMPKPETSLSVPTHMQFTYDDIVELSDNYCAKKLNEEYAQLCRQAIAALCRKRPSPLDRGSDSAWACGVIYAIGSANFLFDKASTPYATGQDLANAFGVSKSTAASKAKQIRDWLKISYFSHQWTLPSRLADSPMAWMISLDGFIVDARNLPRDIQEAAYKKGFIPFIPFIPE